MSFEYFAKYDDPERLPTPPQKGRGKKKSAKPIQFTESTKKRKRTVNAHNEIVVSTRKTPAKAAASTKKASSNTNHNAPTVSAEEEPTTTKSSNTRALRSRNTPVKASSAEHADDAATATAMEVEEGPVPLGDATPHDETQPGGGDEPARGMHESQAKTPSRLQAAKASKRPPTKKRKPNPIPSQRLAPLEFRLATEQEFNDHFNAVVQKEYAVIQSLNPELGDKVGEFMDDFLHAPKQPNELLSAYNHMRLEAQQKDLTARTKRIVAERVQWEGLLNKLNAIDNVAAEMFAEKGVQQFLALPRAPEKKPTDAHTKKILEDILFQSDAIALNLRQNTAFAKKADGHFSSIANLVREKEFPT